MQTGEHDLTMENVAKCSFDQQTWDLTYRKQWGWVNTHGFPTGWVLKSWCQRTIFFITFFRSKWNDKRPHISFPFRLQLAFRVQPIVVQLGDEKGNGHPVEPLMGSPFPCFSHTENDGKPLGVPRKFFGTLEMKGVGRLVIFWFFGEWWHSGFGVYIYIIGTWQKIEPAKLVYHQIASLFRCWRGAACDMNGSQEQWGRFWVYHLDVSPPQMWEQRQDLRYNNQQE